MGKWETGMFIGEVKLRLSEQSASESHLLFRARVVLALGTLLMIMMPSSHFVVGKSKNK